MLKKVLIFGAICTMTCGISFGKTTALDIANRSFQGLEEAGLKYTCRAGATDKEATCLIREFSPLSVIGVKNIQYDLAITDSHATQKVSMDIVTDFGSRKRLKEFEKFVPKHVVCESQSELAQQVELSNVQTCIFHSDVAT